MQKMKKLSQRRSRYPGTIALYLSLISIVIPGQGQETVNLEQAVSQALDNAGNDPVSIEAAIRGIMDQTNPTAAGMKAIASTAMRKVAGYNQRGLMAAVSKGTAGAAISQALKSGVNPLHAAASVTEGLVGAATATIARKGGNSEGTAKAVSQATMQAVVETATGLGIPPQDAANASAFGAMNASMNAAVDYGTNSATMARDVTSGLTAGAITGAIRQQTDPSAVTKAVLTGAVDSIFGKADENNINPDPLIKAAQAGFNQALAAAGTQGGLAKKDAADPNTDIIGSMLQFGGKVLQLEEEIILNDVQAKKYGLNPGDRVTITKLMFIPDQPITKEVTWEITHDENPLVGPFDEPVIDLGTEITEDEVGTYRFIAKTKDGNEVMNKTKLVSLINQSLPPVSPSS
jgi:hypothetical protein